MLIPSKDLDFQFTFNQSQSEILEGLQAAIRDKFGDSCLSFASQVIVVEKNFFHIIKNRHGHQIVGEHIDALQDLLDEYLLI